MSDTRRTYIRTLTASTYIIKAHTVIFTHIYMCVWSHAFQYYRASACLISEVGRQAETFKRHFIVAVVRLRALTIWPHRLTRITYIYTHACENVYVDCIHVGLNIKHNDGYGFI